jgi:hypothetical protein
LKRHGARPLRFVLTFALLQRSKRRASTMRSVWDDNGHFSYHTVGNDLAETALAGWALLLRLMVRRGIRPVQRTRPPWLGTLDRTTLKLLDGLARRDGAHRGERNLKAGTVLVCDYQGRRHIVTVGPDGYVWEGNPYSSLSAIARAITGTVWNGPRFFAIKPASGNDPRLSGHRAAPPAETRRSARTRNNKNNKTSPGNPRSAICLPRKRTMTDPTARPMRCAVCSK